MMFVIAQHSSTMRILQVLRIFTNFPILTNFKIANKFYFLFKQQV